MRMSTLRMRSVRGVMGAARGGEWRKKSGSGPCGGFILGGGALGIKRPGPPEGGAANRHLSAATDVCRAALGVLALGALVRTDELR